VFLLGLEVHHEMFSSFLTNVVKVKLRISSIESRLNEEAIRTCNVFSKPRGIRLGIVFVFHRFVQTLKVCLYHDRSSLLFPVPGELGDRRSRDWVLKGRLHEYGHARYMCMSPHTTWCASRMLLYSNIGTSTAGRYEIVLSAILADFFVERGFVVRMFMLLGYRGHFLLRHVSPVQICLSTHKLSMHIL
jgi:hypothetical protein